MADRGKREIFGDVLGVWQAGPGSAILDLVTTAYVGHMLHMEDGERDRDSYPGWIDSYRSRNPGASFRALDQIEAEDQLFSRVEATRVAADGTALIAHGMNHSRFVGKLIAEEWAIWTGWTESRKGAGTFMPAPYPPPASGP